MKYYKVSMTELFAAMDNLREALDHSQPIFESVLDRLDHGATLSDEHAQWAQSQRARETLVGALTATNSSLMRVRAHFIRVLVDQEDYRIAEVANELGNARQLVKRQYDAAHADLQRRTSASSTELTPSVVPSSSHVLKERLYP